LAEGTSPNNLASILFQRQRVGCASWEPILVVDDESNMRFLLRMILERAGYEVVEAPDGAAALEHALRSPPDLVVTDLMMPVMSGRELIERLRKDPQTAGIPIVVVSANPSAAVEAVDAVLAKPFDPDALLEATRALSGEAA
jgi:CheY-like chemotaxis protein